MNKEKLIIITLLVVLIFLISNYVLNYNSNSSTPTFNEKFTEPPRHSNEELYKDLFISLLHPCIQKSLDDYYGGSTPYDPWDVEIINDFNFPHLLTLFYI